MQSVLNIHWKDWFWSWYSNTLATWCEEPTHWKRPWCWERLKGGGEGEDRGWDSWIASSTQWTWVWASSGSWWWTGNPGVLPSMGSQRVGHDWVTELNWTKNFQIYQQNLEKAEKPQIKLPTFAGSWKKQESSRKTSTFALLTVLKPLTVWIITNWKMVQEMGYQTTWPASWEICLQVKEATVRTGHGTMD